MRKKNTIHFKTTFSHSITQQSYDSHTYANIANRYWSQLAHITISGLTIKWSNRVSDDSAASYNKTQLIALIDVADDITNT